MEAGNAGTLRRTFEEILEFYKTAYKMPREDQRLLNSKLLNLGLRTYDNTRQYFGEARAKFNAYNDRMGEGNVLPGYADYCAKLTLNDVADSAYDQARFLFSQAGDRTGEADVLYWRA